MQISILGCGWLGLPLAKALLAEGYKVKGSTTTPAKLNVLREQGVEPFFVSLSVSGPDGEHTEFLEGSDVVIIDIPPKVKGGESYPQKVESLIPFIEKAGITKVLFVSSTSVYADDNTIVTEDTTPMPDTESGKQVLEAERILQTGNFAVTILRFGGLISEDRHPVYNLEGRQNLPNPDAPVNLIHRNDCIGIIRTIIAQNVWGEIFNGVMPQHPTRREYYTLKAKELGLEMPQFDDAKESIGKTISANNLKSVLQYNFLNQL